MSYRIVKNTFRDGSVKFNIQKQSVYDYTRWNDITVRDNIGDARYAVEVLKGKELESSEVVE